MTYKIIAVDMKEQDAETGDNFCWLQPESRREDMAAYRC